MASSDPSKNAETAPDPDEDDLDELDDMLDQFQATKIKDTAAKPAASTSQPHVPPTASASTGADDAAEPSMDEFAKHIQESMADMLKELEQDPESMKQFEQLMKGFADPKEFDIGDDELKPEGGSGAQKGAGQAEPAASSASSSSAPPPKNPDAAFQDTIKRTMERMKASSQSADTASNNPADDDMMQALLKELAAQGGAGDGDDAFSKMLLGMMEQLTNKEILYEPMKDLNDKFGPWLQENTKDGKLSKEEESRYREQQRLVGEIVKRFDKPGYSDSNAEDREYIVERMQQMQAQGAPPQELVGDMAGAEAMFGDMDQNCAQQ